MADVLDPRYWEDRAAKTREKAEQFSMQDSRNRLLKIAEEYERLAERATERQQAATEGAIALGYSVRHLSRDPRTG
jgi:hypothetical protein